MEEKDIAEVLSEKSRDLKKMFKDIEASLEHWKFSVEETKEGMLVEIQAKALIKRKQTTE